jgi:hypothetical protein
MLLRRILQGLPAVRYGNFHNGNGQSYCISLDDVIICCRGDEADWRWAGNVAQSGNKARLAEEIAVQVAY